jgi:hypothetical protein
MTGMHSNFAEIDPDHVTITNPLVGLGSKRQQPQEHRYTPQGLSRKAE